MTEFDWLNHTIFPPHVDLAPPRPLEEVQPQASHVSLPSTNISLVSATALGKAAQDGLFGILSAASTQPASTSQNSAPPLPAAYQDFGDVFSKAKAETLPVHGCHKVCDKSSESRGRVFNQRSAVVLTAD
ncbi:hypothetical protein M231_03364 [Tremella mesenterica]|uniref:Uncharacterized protein n=1 Tax=Tremella mesenterica TaxID=5217 RepID=A0A4Q1BN46_TREME|nr:hypothetical protein M231_03364 [Tremella mesenterica]